jgi:hypothetical protein
MPKRATVQDARLVLQLHHLRQEREMRKARRWWLDEFWPESSEDYIRVEKAHRSRESHWLRQVISYWGMASSFVLQGTLSDRVFLEQTFSGEMFILYVKVRPFLKELREKTLNPELMRNMEKVILGSKTGRERLKEITKRMAACRKILSPVKKRKGANKKRGKKKG